MSHYCRIYQLSPWKWTEPRSIGDDLNKLLEVGGKELAFVQGAELIAERWIRT